MEREREHYISREKRGIPYAIWSGVSIGVISFLGGISGQTHESDHQIEPNAPVVRSVDSNDLQGEFRIDSLIKKQESLDAKIPAPSPAPTPEPAPDPIVAPAPVQFAEPASSELPQLLMEDARELICAYPWPCEEALAVKFCESGDRWDEVSKGNYGGFQINAVHEARFPDFWESWMDPVKNTSWAYEIWSEQGWKPWGCRPY